MNVNDDRGINFSKGPAVSLTLRAWRKLRCYIERCPTEIGGLGLVEVRSPEELVVTDLFAVRQSASAASTILDADALAEFVTSRARDGFDLSAASVWWHSHGALASYFSHTDCETIDQFTGDFLVSIVGNRREDYLCRVDVFRPIRLGVSVPLARREDDELEAQVAEDIRHLVTREPYRDTSPLTGWFSRTRAR